jgi:tRNA (guanine-N7-)-methyltransferase
VVRQHVNPLSSLHQQPRTLPPPRQLFNDPHRPLHLDIGSARGRFLLAMAPQQPGWNFLGVEIRRGLVDAAELDRQRLDLSNLRFLYCNANVSLQQWLAELPAGLLQRVTIQFPDPWFKRKHQKRRVLQPPLLAAIAAALAPGAEFFLQSDLPEVIEPMVVLTEASGAFERPAADPRPWRPTNPLPVCTERERQVLGRGAPVYRVLFNRKGSAHNPAIAIRP